MGFESIIYREGHGDTVLDGKLDLFKDLALDDIFAAITGHIHDAKIESILYTPLKSEDDIKYRQEIFLDFSNSSVYGGIKSFSNSAETLQYNIEKLKDMGSVQRNRWFLDSVYLYCNSIVSLLKCLGSDAIKSCGLDNFREYLKSYTESDAFKLLIKESSEIERVIESVRYTITIRGTRITVRKGVESDDFGNEVIKIFDRFLDSELKDFRENNSYSTGHVENALVELASRLYPDQFSIIDSFFVNHQNFIDPVIQRFMHEIKFYLKYMTYMQRFINKKLNFCIPEMVSSDDEFYSRDSYDLALAEKLLDSARVPVTNSFYIKHDSRIILVTGPNNGGKTTFARVFGQVYYLASLGIPVPGSNARLRIPDNIYTHFEKTESVENPVGRLEEELLRFHSILELATSRSVIIINEMLSSTTLKDGIEIGKKIIENLKEIGCVVLYVTFIHELASIRGVESYVAQININDPGKRTYKIAPEKSNGMAYAHALAEKYGLSYEDLRRRINNENISEQH